MKQPFKIHPAILLRDVGAVTIIGKASTISQQLAHIAALRNVGRVPGFETPQKGDA